MKLICISASNVKSVEHKGASSHAGQIIRETAQRQWPEAEFELIELGDVELEPCIMCGRCMGSNQCAYDPSFNRLFGKMTEALGIFIVFPHYTFVPAKLTIILEKLQEFAFLHSYNELPGSFVLAGKPVGLVAHGGMVENEKIIKYYKKALLEPVAKALRGVGMRVIVTDGVRSMGVVFGIEAMTRPAGMRLPEFKHDWPSITERLSLLTTRMLETVERGKL